MKLRVALAVVAVALALPMYAQHGAARGGFSGHAGSGGHVGSGGYAGFSGHTGFAGRSGFASGRGVSRLAPFSAQSRFARPAFGRLGAPGFAGTRVPYRGSGFAARRPLYRPAYGDRSRSGYRDHRSGPWSAGVYGYGYPGWGGYPYPYVIDPGFYDWGDSGDSGYGSGGADQGYADLAPDPGYGDGPDPSQEPANAWQQSSSARPLYAGSTATSSAPPLQPLTVIFKNGRASETMQNYMMNSRALTDLDQQHYEQIPLDQIDVAATEQANRARGLNFQVPGASR